VLCFPARSDDSSTSDPSGYDLGRETGATREQPEFREVDLDTYVTLWEKPVRAVEERPPLSQAELDAGWREHPGGLRENVITGEWDDSCFVHVAPRRPRRP
jgi:hypothetical protein